MDSTPGNSGSTTPSSGNRSEGWLERSSSLSSIDAHSDPVVIVGLGCRLPGDNSSPSKLWDFLQSNQSAQGPWPQSRLNVNGFYHPNRNKPDSVHTTGGYFLQEDLHNFDNDFFGINNLEATRMDAQQKKLLEVVYECFENSGTPLEKVSGRPVGCYVANFLVDHAINQARDQEVPDPYAATGVTATILANRISHVFNLQGPSLVVDTACSASIYALHLACQALQGGECESAVVAASNLVQSLAYHILNVKSGVLSGTSTCHTFDISADGYGRADAVSAIYLKRLSAALRDGDRIRAVIRGSAVNSNGRTAGISLPQAETQAQVIRNAYANAGLSMDDTAYVEAHGTGTAVGDPIELHGISQAFQRHKTPHRKLRVGSVKTNLGHSEAASGLTSVMKMVLSFENDLLPATIGVRELNPKIKANEWNLEVVTENTPWPEGYQYQRASVNSFGFGGANAHVILESIGSYLAHHPWLRTSPNTDNSHDRRSKFLLPVSALNPKSLQRVVESYSTLQHIPDLRSLVSESCLRRTLSHPTRGFVILGEAVGHRELPSLPLESAGKASTTPPALAFVFTGQGAQWPGMGRELLIEFPRFKDAILQMDKALQDLPDGPAWHIEDAILASAETSQIHTAAFSQPICTAIQVGLVTILADFGILPTGIIGHSSGEIAAAFAAGILTAMQAIVCAYYRGKSVSELDTDGAMLATQLTETEAIDVIAQTHMQDKVAIACLNSPNSITLSGDRDGIEVVQAALKAESKFARTLNTGGKAYHSHHMKRISAGYHERLVRSLGPASTPDPTKRFISTRTNARVELPLQAAYWHENAECSVLFSPGLKTLLTDHAYHLVEIGPHSTLAMPIKQIVKDMTVQPSNFAYFSALSRGSDSCESLLKLVGKLFLAGHNVDFAAVNGLDTTQFGSKRSLELPNYPWNYENVLKCENRPLQEYLQRKHPRHDLLGSEQFGLSKRFRTWRNLLAARDLPWLMDHRLGETVVFPAAGYCTIAIEAALQSVTSTDEQASLVSLTDLTIAAPLLLATGKKDRGSEIFTYLKPTTHNIWDFEISSIQGGEALLHAKGTVEVSAGEDDLKPRVSTTGLTAVEEVKVPQSDFYKRLEMQGLCFGTAFQSVSELGCYHVAGTYVARGRTSAHREKRGEVADESTYSIHPITLDALLQTSIVATGRGQLDDLKASVPTYLGSFTIDLKRFGLASQSSTYNINANALVHEFCQTVIEADLISTDNHILAQISDVRLASFDGGHLQEAALKRQPFTQLVWKPDVTLNKTIELTEASLAPFSDRRELRCLLDLVCHKHPNLKILEISSDDHEILAPGLCAELNQDNSLQRYATFTRATLTSDGQLLPLGDDDSSFEKGPELDLVVFSHVSILERMLQDGSVSSLNLSDHALLLFQSPNDVKPTTVGQVFTSAHSSLGQTAVLCRPSEVVRANKETAVDRQAIVLIEPIESEEMHHVDALVEALLQNNLQVTRLRFDEASINSIPQNTTIVALVELFRPLLASVSAHQFTALQALISRASQLLWVCGGHILTGENPDFALIQGIARTVRLEQPETKFSTLSASNDNFNPATLAAQIISVTSEPPSGFPADSEFSSLGGILSVSRLAPREALNRLYRQKENLEDSTKPLRECKKERLSMTSPGWPETLRFVNDKIDVDDLEPDQVEVAVQTVGLTAKNVSVLQGRATNSADKPVTQFAGIINRVGSDVAGFQQGDRVVGLSSVHLKQFVQVPSTACQKMLKGENASVLSLVPVPHCTALHALKDRMNIQPNESLLVHWTGGDAEVAAIKLAQSMGARVYTIAGTDDDRNAVIAAAGVSPASVSTMDDTDLLEALRRFTKGEGFDCFITSQVALVGLRVWKSLSSCARCAFLELGPSGTSQLDSSRLPCNGTVTHVSLDHLLNCPCEQHRRRLSQLLKNMLAICRLDEISFATDYSRIDVSELIEQVEKLPKSQVVRRLVLSMENGDSPLKVNVATHATSLDPNKSFLLVGCLGGLGRAISKWMFDRGARHFVYLGRSGLDRKAARDLVEDLETAGALVDVIRGDATSAADVTKMVRAARTPIGGVLQAAMGLEERTFAKSDAASWHSGIDAKVQGTWNLHNSLLQEGQTPDFFLLLSSLNGSLGAFMESNYCAANAFLDAFARYRRRRGLPCVSLALGAISEVGYVAENPKVEAHFLRKGIRPLKHLELLQMIDTAVATSSATTKDVNAFDELAHAHILTGLEPLDDKMLEALSMQQKNPVEDDPRAVLWNKAYVGEQASRSDDKDALTSILATIQSCVAESSESGAAGTVGSDHGGAVKVVVALVAQGLSDLIVRAIDQIETSKPIARYGLDSMLGAEFRTWFHKTFKVDVPLMEIMSNESTVESLGQQVCDRLSKTVAVAAQSTTPTTT